MNQVLNGLLAAMVALYGILTPATVFNASQAEGNANRNYELGAASLSDANFYYSEANRTISYDIWLVDQMVINEEFGATDALFDYLEGSLSPAAIASLDRDSPFDDQYLNDLYVTANSNQTHSDQSYQLAGKWERRSDAYELFVTLMSVGLSFSAWASLMQRPTFVKYIFTFMSALILAISVIAVLFTWLFAEALPQVIT